ncbi:MAG: class I SAM-dependent methyltransferase [Sphaerochaeta sp.]
MDTYVEHNAKAWDGEVDKQTIWTDGCSEEQIEKARNGELDMVLSPFKRVPSSWVTDITGKEVLALASGGGQQAVLLALAGAHVTLFDVSEKQLSTDRAYAERLNLDMEFVRGDMRDLSCFCDASFSMIYNPTSTCFIDDVHHMYTHCYRILEQGGRLLTSITNPALYLFDEKKALKNKLKVKYTIPYSDLHSLSKQELEKRMQKKDTIEFSHTLEDLLGGLTDCGFHLTGIYSDTAGFMMIDSYIHDCYLAVRAEKCL